MNMLLKSLFLLAGAQSVFAKCKCVCYSMMMDLYTANYLIQVEIDTSRRLLAISLEMDFSQLYGGRKTSSKPASRQSMLSRPWIQR